MPGIARVSRIGVPHFGQSGTSPFGSVEVITAAAEPPITTMAAVSFSFLPPETRMERRVPGKGQRALPFHYSHYERHAASLDKRVKEEGRRGLS
jgi:hypothetical protein